MPWYTIRSKKRDASNAEIKWSNVYEVRLQVGVLNSDQANIIMGAIRDFEVALHYNSVEMYDMTCSTWVADEVEEEEDGLFTFEGDPENGGRALIDDAAPLEEALYIVKVPTRGNKGRLSLRGCLQLNELAAVGRKFTLLSAARAGLTTILTAEFITLSEILDNISCDMGLVSYPKIGTTYTATAPGVKQIPVPQYSTTPYERSIKRMQVGGVSHLDMDHAYYDVA
jgi:hypothetical protein